MFFGQEENKVRGKAQFQGRAAEQSTSGLLSWDTADHVQGSRDMRSNNAFASGANQNCGNVITDRSSVRIHEQPGGVSQMGNIMSWDQNAQEPPQRDMRSNNQYANAASQNCGNFITDRPSVQVQQPSGGRGGNAAGGHQSNIITWGGADEHASPIARGRRGGGGDQDYAAGSRAAPTGGQSEMDAIMSQADNYRAVSSNAYASGANQNCGNGITDRPMTKVQAPPGGHSSFQLG